MPIGISMENEVLAFVSKRVAVGEPSTIAMMNGMGKNVLFQHLSTNLKNIVKKEIIELKIADDNDFENLIKQIDEHYHDSIFLVILENDLEYNKYLERINTYRLKYSHDFVFILITTLSPILQALQNSLKIVTKSLYVCKPVNEKDSKIVTAAHQSYYNYKIPDETQKEIFDLSGGNIGIMKCIFLYLWEKESTTVEIDDLLRDRNLLGRLKSIKNELPDSAWKNILNNNSNFPEYEIAKEFGFIKDMKIFSILFEKYLKISYQEPINIEEILTSTEMKVLNVIKDYNNKIVSRDEFAKLIWGKDWPDKYSDWAIDQFVSRFKRKLKNINTSFQIETKKGKGFIIKQMI